MNGRIAIDNITPVVCEKKYPSKAVIGEYVPITASIWKEGHDLIGAHVVSDYCPHDALSTCDTEQSVTIPMMPLPKEDRFIAMFCPSQQGMWNFRIKAYMDTFQTWRYGIEKKLEAGFTADQLHNELLTGSSLFHRATTHIPTHIKQLQEIAQQLATSDIPLHMRVSAALSPEIHELFKQYPLQDLVTLSEPYPIFADRNRALYSSWYEFFPRSTGGWNKDGKPIHGNFDTSCTQLPRIAQMGFNVVYLPPIHPIGTTHRKGANNSLTAQPHDVGSPWAIGASDGGHTAIHSQLGTIQNFQNFVQTARSLDIEVALDFALQCSPDHPWVKEHPEWFTILPDQTIAYAENPPKKYHDIYPLNFDKDPTGLFQATLDILLYWIDNGVTIFRVDNPHTKPPHFWEWIIYEIKKQHPQILFLAEAFTRPARLYGLAQRGFSQSYTYFTWRTYKNELIEFITELVTHADISRPNLFTNTPDILHASLQTGGKSMFAIRAALAATISPSWGIYSGFELFESRPIHEGSEEYYDSEKYQLRPRDFSSAEKNYESLAPWIKQLNHIRDTNPAFQQLRNIAFHPTHNDNLLAYSKFDQISGNIMLVVINLDPFNAQEGNLEVYQPLLGQSWGSHCEVRDITDGSYYWWGQQNYIRLEPWKSVCHIIRFPPIPTQHRAAIARNYYSHFFK